MEYKSKSIENDLSILHTEPEISYCHGTDHLTGQSGWFVYKQTTHGLIATTPVFEEWVSLLFHVGQEGYTVSLARNQTFVKRELVTCL